tara:strand:- start:9644 stop:10399 length:756 start_codon:yes stop_codon:yes gene_type:complete
MKQGELFYKNELRTFKSENGPNSHKVILSLFDLSKVWCQPYIDAGYTVVPMDMQADGIDLSKMDGPELAVDIIGDRLGLPPFHVYGILLHNPCCNFACSGARWFKGKDADGTTQKSIDLLINSMKIIKYFSHDSRTNTIAEFNADSAYKTNPDAGLRFWALENPVGRINSLIPSMSKFGPQYFQPHHYGSPYTKKTGLWGRYNFPFPTNDVDPTEGSKMWKMFPTKNPMIRKNARSKTDPNFAQAFFEMNK